MDSILDQIKEYFKNTPQEQIKKDWDSSAKYDEVGPPASEYIEYLKKLMKNKLKENKV